MASFLKTFILGGDRVIVKKLRKSAKANYIFLRHGYDPVYSSKSRWPNRDLLAAFSQRKTTING